MRTEDLPPPRQLRDRWTVYGKAYEMIREGDAVPTTGRMYTFNREERCYRIKLESTSPDRRYTTRMHERIISSLGFIE